MRSSVCSLAPFLMMFCLIACSTAEDKQARKNLSNAQQAIACKSDAPAVVSTVNKTEKAQRTVSLNAFLSQRADAPQHFQVSAEKRSMVRGKKGIVIDLDPMVLETEDGHQVSGKIDVSLVEMTNAIDFFRNNAPTVSDGKLLSSGGSCILSCSSEGKALRIKAGKTLGIAFPGNASGNMSTFYGQRAADGLVNWTPDAKPVVTQRENMIWVEEKDYTYKDSIIMEMNSGTSVNLDKYRLLGINARIRFDSIAGKAFLVTENPNERIDSVSRFAQIPESQRLRHSTYNMLRVNQFGLINCDRFMGEKLVPLLVAADAVPREDEVIVMTIIDQSRSYFQNNLNFDGTSHAGAVNLPTGYNARVIAVSYAGNKLSADYRNITSGTNQPLRFQLQPVSIDKLERIVTGRT